jgi:aspartate aminotransferase
LFLSRFYYHDAPKEVYLSDPTWGEVLFVPFSCKLSLTRLPDVANHHAILKNVGIEPICYPYYDPKTVSLDLDGMTESLKNAPPRSVFLLHACAHNPTGIDPTQEQWKAIADIVIEKNHYAFFDCAYQGFASGDLDRDAQAVRYFVERGVPMLVCQVGLF